MNQPKEISISIKTLWDVVIQFTGKRQDFKKKIWEFRTDMNCLIVVYFDRFDGYGGPHRNIEVFPMADITFSSCKEIDRPEPPRIITPDAIIDTKKSQPAPN